MKKAVFSTAALAIGMGLVGGAAASASAAPVGDAVGLLSATELTPSVLPAADAMERLSEGGGLTKGNSFDGMRSGNISGVYLDSGPTMPGATKPDVPFNNPVGKGDLMVHPLNAPGAAGLGALPLS